LSQRSDGQILDTEIQKLQQLESNKLVLTAAQHLDCIRSRFPELAVHMGLESQTDSPYNGQKISECEENIRNILENLQSLKCDLLE
jgi:hypothetical protein